MGMTTAERQEIRDLLKDGFDSHKDYLEAVIRPIHEKVETHETMCQEFPIVKQKLNDHIQDHKEKTVKKRFNIEMWLVVGIYLADKLFEYLKSLSA